MLAPQETVDVSGEQRSAEKLVCGWLVAVIKHKGSSGQSVLACSSVDRDFKAVSKVAVRSSLDCIPKWGVSRATLWGDAVVRGSEVVGDVARERRLELEDLSGLGGRWFVRICDERRIARTLELKRSRHLEGGVVVHPADEGLVHKLVGRAIARSLLEDGGVEGRPDFNAARRSELDLSDSIYAPPKARRQRLTPDGHGRGDGASGHRKGLFKNGVIVRMRRNHK